MKMPSWSKRFWSALILGSLTLLVTTCSQVPTPSDLMPAIVQGQVTQTVISPTGRIAQQGVTGAELVVMRYDADGNAHRVEADRVYSGAHGDFRLAIYAPGESGLVIRAVKGAERWQTIISDVLQPGIKMEISPMNYRTTIAAKVFLSLPADNNFVFEDVLEKIPDATDMNTLPQDDLVEELIGYYRSQESITGQAVTTSKTSVNTSQSSQPAVNKQAVHSPKEEPRVQVNSDIRISDSIQRYITDLTRNSKTLEKPVRFMIQVKKNHEAVITREEVEGAASATQHRLWSGLKTTMLHEVEMNKNNTFSGAFLLTIHPG